MGQDREGPFRGGRASSYEVTISRPVKPRPLAQARQIRPATPVGALKPGPGRQIVSQDSQSSVSRIAGQAGTQVTDPTPPQSQTPGRRAGAPSTSSLPNTRCFSMGSSLPSRRTERPVRWFASGGGVWQLIGASRSGSCGVPVLKRRLAAPPARSDSQPIRIDLPAGRRPGGAPGGRYGRCRGPCGAGLVDGAAGAGQEASGQSLPAWLSWCGHRQPGGSPGLEAADHVCCAGQAQGLQRCGGQRR